MANYPSKFIYDPEWVALEDHVRDVLKHDHDPGPVPGRDLDALITLLTQRDRQLEDYLGGLSSGAAIRPATTVVAANNSRNKTQADLVCTGTNDHLIVQQACGNGGGVLLLEGAYNFFTSDPTPVHLQPAGSLRGQGADTVVNMLANPTQNTGIVGGNQSLVSDLFIDGHSTCIYGIDPANVNNSDAYGIVENIWAQNFAGGAVAGPNAGLSIVSKCHFLGTSGALSYGSSQVNDLIVSECEIGGQCLYATNLNAKLMFRNNLFTRAGQLQIIGSAALASQVLGNTFDSTTVTPLDILSNSCLVANNTFTGCQNGVVLDAGAFDQTFIDNVIQGTLAGGYHLSVSGTNSVVRGNTIRGNARTNAIQVLASATGALVALNDLRAGWATAAISDLGTGTLFNYDGSAANWNRT